MAEECRDWNQRYMTGDTPWDSGIRSRELTRVLKDVPIRPCRAIELGCGTGTNAIFLAQQGFDVTAVDLSPRALEQAIRRADEADVVVDFLHGDVCRFDVELAPFEFGFDRGCYHCVRKIDLPGFLETLRRLTKPGSRWLSLTGNANEQTETGPPRLHEREIRADLGELFDFDFIREIRFEDKGGVDGPLGWSCLMTRKPDS
jgi:SAM-dependent methyltransferase